MGKASLPLRNEPALSGAYAARLATAELKRGPPHMPIFVMRGLVETASGAVLHTEPVVARSKKEGELAVAGPLLALAIERSGEAAPDGRDMSTS